MTRLKAVYQTCFALSIALWASPTLGHEFWIDPVDPSVAPGDEIVADNRVGENLKGSGMIYNPNSFTQFVMIDPDGVQKRTSQRPTTDGDQRFVLLYKGKPKPNHQVDVFRRPAEAEDVVMSSLQTDALGEVIVPREAGEIMLNAVVLEEPRPSMAEKLDAVWVSLWASTTYTIED